jgi:hypothetical protein
MPKVEIDYSNTIIYKITCKDPNIKDVYVGHTTNFVQRKHAHKQSCINVKSLNHNCKLYQVIRNNGGWSNWCMEIVHFCNCKDHYEARKKEQEYFELLHATLNSIEPMPKPKSIPEKNIKENIPKQIYYCDICKVKFQNLNLMEIHNKTNKHIKKKLSTELSTEGSYKYHCILCDYNTSRKSQYTRHLNTPKHAENNKTATKTDKKEQPHICGYCKKEYKERTGLWRHKKKCTFINENTQIVINDDYNNDDNDNDNNSDHGDNGNTVKKENNPQMDVLINLFQEQLKENKELKELIIEQQKKILEMGVGTNITNNNITQNNNKFNLNVFLNETCKDALNLSDFLESLILSLTDFENFGPLGYCGGISNILVKGLNNLDISKRPIHCSDLKREVIHVKNNDTWHKDDDKQQMIKAIKAIEHKNVKQMSLWAKANPEYKDPNHKKSDLYTKLIDQSLGDTDKEKAMKNYNKIIRTVAKEILVDK